MDAIVYSTVGLKNWGGILITNFLSFIVNIQKIKFLFKLLSLVNIIINLMEIYF